MRAGPVCKAAACGKGNCTETSGLPGYMCDCDPGWTQMHVGDHLRFLPCVIPNCKCIMLLLPDLRTPFASFINGQAGQPTKVGTVSCA
jgi:hypothetical protein